MISKSSTEAEFKVLAYDICEEIQLQRVLGELRIPSSEPMKMFYESQFTINVEKNFVHHDRIKYVEIDSQIVEEKINSRRLSLWHIQFSHQIAYIFTKTLPSKTFEKLSSKLGLLNIFKPI